MAIGIDVSTQLKNPPLEGDAINWTSFIENRLGHHNLFVGRYFVNKEGTAHDPCDVPQQKKSDLFWVPGELDGTPKEIRYIFPISGTESYTTVWKGEPQLNQFFYRQSGFCAEDTDMAKDRQIFKMGYYWGFRTCQGIAKALDFRDGTGNPEVVLPASGSVYVYLGAEPWTIIHRRYWAGWSSAVRVYNYNDPVTGRLQMPFWPGIYCYYFDGKDKNGVPLGNPPQGIGQYPFAIPGPVGTLPANGTIAQTLNSSYGRSCVGFFATQAQLWDGEANHIDLDAALLVPDKIDKFAESIQNQWDDIFTEEFSVQSNGQAMKIPVFLWQFAIDLAGPPGGHGENAVGSTLLPEFANLRLQLGVDLVVTNPNIPAPEDLDQLQITDHMLVRYPP